MSRRRLRSRPVPLLAGLLAAICSIHLASTNLAQAATAIAVAKAAGGQPELAVGFDPSGLLRAKIGTGASSAASLVQGIALDAPAALRAKASETKFEIVPIGSDRHAVVVTIPADAPHRTWQALIVAKPGKNEPEILFQGYTGLLPGEDGLRTGPLLEISDPIDDQGTRRIVLGELREDLSLCGRPTTLAPRMLSPKDLTLRPAKVQRLSAEERERAPELVAEPTSSPAASQASVVTTQPTKEADASAKPATSTANPSTAATTTASATATATTAAKSGSLGSSATLLRPLGASSAIGWPAALTDGDPETTWAENRGGAGRGEFVTFRAPSDVPLQGFRFVVRPEKKSIPNGAGPERLWLVTNGPIYSVRFPTDPWKAPLVQWHVALPAAVRTDCVAIVAESAYGEKPNTELTLAEVAADSEFASANIEQLVGALAGGGARAEAAGSVLSALGAEAQAAVARAFGSLDEDGRRVALDVLDHAPCGESSPVYIEALLGNVEAHRLHAIDRLRRCGPTVVAPIEQALGARPTPKHRPLLELFTEVAPDRAIAYLAPRLVGNPKHRRWLRELVTQAARSPKASDTITTELASKELPKSAVVDLMRALGARLERYAEVAVPRLEGLLENETDWKTRYLLVEPAHRLAKASRILSKRLAETMSKDPRFEVRLEAVRSTIDVELFANEILAATSDPEVRVREAATQVLAKHHAPNARAALAERLNVDPWPLVRAQAAESLATQPQDSTADHALVDALDDSAWVVRAAVAEAIGKKQISLAGAALLDRFEDKDERVEVRLAAVSSLGQLCYEPALDSLTDQARKLSSPGMDLRARSLSASALAALAEIHPADLAKRLDPLLSNSNVSPEVRRAVKAALATETRCQPAKAPRTAWLEESP
ncbi:MAG: HEAT repeat domain-containing protein [Polyangiaceae bacterium]